MMRVMPLGKHNNNKIAHLEIIIAYVCCVPVALHALKWLIMMMMMTWNGIRVICTEKCGLHWLLLPSKETGEDDGPVDE